MGFPIQRSPGHSLFNDSPKLFAVNHVFLRHPAPRHPPSALISLFILNELTLFLSEVFPQAPLILILYIQFSMILRFRAELNAQI